VARYNRRHLAKGPPRPGPERALLGGERQPSIIRIQESSRLMLSDPRSVDRLLSYMSKAVWLIMAYSFGTMVGRLILLLK
jgi:hypothetical protein